MGETSRAVVVTAQYLSISLITMGREDVTAVICATCAIFKRHHEPIPISYHLSNAILN